ncbi:hypothetical protein EMPS_02881 [Entomortierella parvispora]|uniref:Thioesterase domain-containing protein n=1 Tax=Entomortierella parvispora TaxID=205924 RepID=A0A9P3H6A8_9FUNG|nr:hypothetical protein EMPS_02881 [Entomortierella parvispora]
MLVILAACGLAFALVFIAVVLVKHTATLRDPLVVWDRIQGFEYLPVRIRAWLFSYALGIANPYSRSINCRFTEETKQVSNPFRSVHAGALVTFGETVGALALFTLLGKKDRAILTNIQVEYVRVARGLLTASATVSEEALRKSCISPLAQELEADLAKEKASSSNSGSTVNKDTSTTTPGIGSVTGGRATGNNLFVTDVLIRNANFDIVAKLALTWKTDLKND